MDDGESSWLHDEHRMILYALVSLAVVVGGHRGWQEYHKYQESAVRRARILRLVENTKREKERIDSKTTQPALTEDPLRPVTEPLRHAPGTLKVTTPDVDDGSIKADSSISKRSKERRRRGRDTYKEVTKREKKVKIGSQKTHLPVASSSGSQRGSNSSRSHSTARSYVDYDSAIDTPKPSGTSQFSAFSAEDENVNLVNESNIVSSVSSHFDPDQGTGGNSTQELTVVSPIPQTTAPSETAQTLDVYSLPPRRSRSKRNHSPIPHDAPAVEHSSSQPSSSAGSPSTASSRDSSVSFDEPQANTSCLPISVSQPLPSGSVQPPWLEKVPHSKSHPTSLSSASTSSLPTSDSSWEWDTQSQLSSNYRKSPPPRFRSRSRASASPLPMPPSSSGDSLLFPTLNSTPPPNASLSAQMASYKGALEAARLREEKYKQDIDRFSKECDILRWKWNEDASAWKRREAELQTHMHHLMHQLHALSLAASSPTHLQPFIPQSQHSPHGHAGFPVLAGIPLGSPYGYAPTGHPHSAAGPMPYPFLPSHPSHVPQKAARRASASNSASPSLDGSANGRGNDDDGGFSDELAEAILKRPESIRSPSSASGSSVIGRVTKNGFSFPSLSELGNPQRGTVEDDGDVDGDKQVGEGSDSNEDEATPDATLENFHANGSDPDGHRGMSADPEIPLTQEDMQRTSPTRVHETRA